MNVGTDALTAVERVEIVAEVAALLSDADLGASVIVTTPGASALDPQTGTVTATTTTSDTVVGWWSPLTARESGPDSAYQIGDRRFTVPAGVLTVVPTTAAGIVEGTDRYSVVAVETAQLGGSTVHYNLIARRAA